MLNPQKSKTNHNLHKDLLLLWHCSELFLVRIFTVSTQDYLNLEHANTLSLEMKAQLIPGA